MLFATNTTLSVPALTGAIMCMGVATANSGAGDQLSRVERLAELGDATAAALDAGFVRFRPGADDRARHDHRYDADGARVWVRAANRTRRSAAP